MNNLLSFALPIFIIFLVYFSIRDGRKKRVKELELKDSISEDDELDLHVGLAGEYMFLLVGITLLIYIIIAELSSWA